MPWRRKPLSYRSIKPMFKFNIWKILQGDFVEIIKGKDKGKQGIVREVNRDHRRPQVKIEGCNLAKRKIKRDVVTGNPGGHVLMEMPIHYCNVMLVDPITKKPVRVVYKYTPDGEKVRVTKGKNASYSVIPNPPVFKEEVDRVLGEKDTPAALARKQTYFPEQEYGFQQVQLYSTSLQRQSQYQQQQQLVSLYGRQIRKYQQIGYSIIPLWWKRS
eukprot:TRINITY_DN2052_c0_g2_i3.p1 TRINITY_DN2052_c0_g2~~TRINITY_DN2052_c0_g2_i3.p1  ORF type:complete len:215 (+),score=25.36 TRINITY_DN2052_c0_g2_i3:75-719(+)